MRYMMQIKNIIYKAQLWLRIIIASRGSSRPIIIYQPGKVGSSTIYESLRKQIQWPVFHTHRLYPPHVEALRESAKKMGQKKPIGGEFNHMLYRKLINKHIPLDIIVLVREPIERNFSAYFENLDRFWGIKNAHEAIKIKELISNFLSDYPHRTQIDWFDQEFLPTLGINIYDYPFDKESGIQVIEKSPIRILLMKVEVPNSLKHSSVAEFLDLPLVALSDTNVAAHKKYRAQYVSFKQEINLPKQYVDEMLESKFSKYFYTDVEREEVRKKWATL